MRKMWTLAPVLFPVISGAALQIWNPDQNKMRTVVAALFLLETTCSWLVVLNYLGMRLPLRNIGPGMELCLRLGGIGALFSGLASLIWVLVIFFAFKHMEHEREETRFFGCLIISLGALARVAYAGNFVTLYLSFEMTAFFSVPLVFHSGKREALRTGVVYLAYSMLGASIALGGYFFFHRYACGMGFKAGGVLVGAVGAAQDGSQIILLSIFCMAAGFSYGTGLMPLHPWLPIAHPIAPTPVSAVLSGLIIKAWVVAATRVVYGMVGSTFLRGTWVQHAPLSTAVLTIFAGSMLAYKRKKLKRRLAYSSFSQVSYALFGIFLLPMEEFYGSLLQMVFHALAENTLFLCAGAVVCKTGCVRTKEMRGMGGRVPAVMLCLTLTSLSLIGIPPASGFLAKWHLAVGAMRTEAGLLTWLGLVILVVSALLTAGYLFPVIVEGFFPGKDRKKTKKSEAGRSCAGTSAASVSIKVPLAMLGISLLVLGALGKPVFKLLKGIASAVM